MVRGLGWGRGSVFGGRRGGGAIRAVPPIRSIPSYQGQRHSPVLYWSATVSAHVEFESWLKCDEALALDFDPDVSGFAAQPFWLFRRYGQEESITCTGFLRPPRRYHGGGGRPAVRIKPPLEPMAQSKAAIDSVDIHAFAHIQLGLPSRRTRARRRCVLSANEYLARRRERLPIAAAPTSLPPARYR